MSAPVLKRLFSAQGETARSLLGHPRLGRPGSASREAGSPCAASGLGPRTPGPSLQSHSFSRGCGTILPTSLIYIALSTRGCSPWRPAADMGTSWRESAVISLGFSRSHRPLVGAARTAALFAKTKTRSPCEMIPGPRRLMQKRKLSPELRWASPSRVALPRRNTRFRNGSTARFWNKDQIPFRLSCSFTKENAAHLIKVSPKP